MVESVTPLDQAVDTLDRLRRHVVAVRNQKTTARDDLAVVLHLLVGSGDGYGIAWKASQYVGAPIPQTSAWSSEMALEADGLPLMLGLRAMNRDEMAPMLDLPDVLDQTCLRFAMPGLEPEANWSWADLIRKVRNKFGGHVDSKPPTWLQDLRYYPAADTDAVSFLLWSVGEAVLRSVSRTLAAAGVDIEPYEPADEFLDGIALYEGLVFGDPGVKLDVRAHLRCEKWASGRRRAILGAKFDDRPFIFGLEGDGRLSLTQGPLGGLLRGLERDFRLPPGGGSSRPNRAARRAAESRRRRGR